MNYNKEEGANNKVELKTLVIIIPACSFIQWYACLIFSGQPTVSNLTSPHYYQNQGDRLDECLWILYYTIIHKIGLFQKYLNNAFSSSSSLARSALHCLSLIQESLKASSTEYLNQNCHQQGRTQQLSGGGQYIWGGGYDFTGDFSEIRIWNSNN